MRFFRNSWQHKFIAFREVVNIVWLKSFLFIWVYLVSLGIFFTYGATMYFESVISIELLIVFYFFGFFFFFLLKTVIQLFYFRYISVKFVGIRFFLVMVLLSVVLHFF